MRHLLILACLLVGTGAAADEADFDFKSLGAKKALRDYKKSVVKDEKAQAQKQKELDEAGAKAAKTTRDAFAERLKKALKHAMQDTDLEEANKIDAAIKALKQGSPAGGSAANRKAQKETKRPTKVTYWPNGQKRLEEHWKDDKQDGLETAWYENGQKSSERHYKNGKQDGLATGWHENGQKKIEHHFKNGKRDGLETYWNENGQKRWERHYKNGERDGLWTFWYENGQKKSEARYKNGKRVR
jgi:antitoxin component YwqK of YwqJK toxin-antitoxin module